MGKDQNHFTVVKVSPLPSQGRRLMNKLIFSLNTNRIHCGKHETPNMATRLNQYLK